MSHDGAANPDLVTHTAWEMRRPAERDPFRGVRRRTPFYLVLLLFVCMSLKRRPAAPEPAVAKALPVAVLAASPPAYVVPGTVIALNASRDRPSLPPRPPPSPEAPASLVTHPPPLPPPPPPPPPLATVSLAALPPLPSAAAGGELGAKPKLYTGSLKSTFSLPAKEESKERRSFVSRAGTACDKPRVATALKRRRAEPAPSGTKRLVFAKFHQIGGTTVAYTLYKAAATPPPGAPWLAGCCCPGCDVCAEHVSLGCIWPARPGGHCLGRPRAEVVLVTLLREPVDKLLGKYYFLRSRRADSGKGAPERGDPLASLELWADDCRHQNEYAQILGNAELPPAPPLGEGFACKRECAPPSAAQAAATRAAIERAKATLDEFDVVGTTEGFDRFMVRVAHAMGWDIGRVAYRRLKTVVGRPTVGDHPPRVAAALARALAPDVEIHAHAAALADAQERAFDARAASFGPGAPLSAQMQAFERLQAQVNQSCEYGNVNMGGLIGQDCYTMDAGESAQWSVMSAAAASR